MIAGVRIGSLGYARMEFEAAARRELSSG